MVLNRVLGHRRTSRGAPPLTFPISAIPCRFGRPSDSGRGDPADLPANAPLGSPSPGATATVSTAVTLAGEPLALHEARRP
jgi:hypothetical protein